MPIIAMLLFAGALGSMIILYFALRGPSVGKAYKRRIELLKERHGDVLAGQAQAQIRKLLSRKGQTAMDSWLSTMLPKPALLKLRLDRTRRCSGPA
jgi:tight adherence protein B